MDKYRFYDIVVGNCIADLVNRSKNYQLNLSKLNIHNENHLCLFHIAQIASNCYGLKVSVQMNWLKYQWFSWQFKCRKTVKRCKDKKDLISCPDYLFKFKLAIQDLKLFNNEAENYAMTTDLFAKIYREYYKEAK